MTQRSALGISMDPATATWNELANICEHERCGKPRFEAMKELTSPTTADTRNLTQSIGVKLGFFFSGCLKRWKVVQGWLVMRWKHTMQKKKWNLRETTRLLE